MDPKKKKKKKDNKDQGKTRVLLRHQGMVSTELIRQNFIMFRVCVHMHTHTCRSEVDIGALLYCSSPY